MNEQWPKNNESNDIDNDEIRVISPLTQVWQNLEKEPPLLTEVPKKKRMGGCLRWFLITAAVVVGLLVVLVLLMLNTPAYDSDSSFAYEARSSRGVRTSSPTHGYVERTDMKAGDVDLTVLRPVDADDVKLTIGYNTLKDPRAILVVQAADVRADNGGIVGSFVKEGELISRGDSKAGFCAIIDGKPIVGVADATQYLDKAIESGGYFFRQFPLVVGGQVVDNNMDTKSYRKALAQMGSNIVVVMSNRKLTMNEFSEALVKIGVSNAIYLVGSTSPGFYKTKSGEKVEFGEPVEEPHVMANYIVWF